MLYSRDGYGWDGAREVLAHHGCPRVVDYSIDWDILSILVSSQHIRSSVYSCKD